MVVGFSGMLWKKRTKPTSAALSNCSVSFGCTAISEPIYRRTEGAARPSTHQDVSRLPSLGPRRRPASEAASNQHPVLYLGGWESAAVANHKRTPSSFPRTLRTLLTAHACGVTRRPSDANP